MKFDGVFFRLIEVIVYFCEIDLTAWIFSLSGKLHQIQKIIMYTFVHFNISFTQFYFVANMKVFKKNIAKFLGFK